MPVDFVSPALGFGRMMPPEPVADATAALIAERRGTHGDWAAQAAIAHAIKAALRSGPAWCVMTPGRREALDMVAVKMSRAVTGNPDHADHWDDMAGYARLGKQGHDRPAATDVVKDWPGNT
jgi:hypothetical protein